MEIGVEDILVIKATCGYSNRRLTLRRTPDLSIASLHDHLRQLFGISTSSSISSSNGSPDEGIAGGARERLVVTYRDSEGDAVDLIDDRDLKDALFLQKLNPLRLNVTVEEGDEEEGEGGSGGVVNGREAAGVEGGAEVGAQAGVTDSLLANGTATPGSFSHGKAAWRRGGRGGVWKRGGRWGKAEGIGAERVYVHVRSASGVELREDHGATDLLLGVTLAKINAVVAAAVRNRSSLHLQIAFAPDGNSGHAIGSQPAAAAAAAAAAVEMPVGGALHAVPTAGFTPGVTSAAPVAATNPAVAAPAAAAAVAAAATNAAPVTQAGVVSGVTGLVPEPLHGGSNSNSIHNSSSSRLTVTPPAAAGGMGVGPGAMAKAGFIPNLSPHATRPVSAAAGGGGAAAAGVPGIAGQAAGGRSLPEGVLAAGGSNPAAAVAAAAGLYGRAVSPRDVRAVVGGPPPSPPPAAAAGRVPLSSPVGVPVKSVGGDENVNEPYLSAAAAAAAAAVATAVVHEGIECDLCRMCPIVGARYKSNVLPDFDLCRACFESDGEQGCYDEFLQPLPASPRSR